MARTTLLALALLWNAPALAQDADAPDTTDDAAEDKASDDAEEGATKPDDEAEETRDAMLMKLAKRLEELEGQVAEQADKIAAQDKALQAQRSEVTKVKAKAFEKKDLAFDIGGYYRARGHVFGAKWGKKPTTGGLFADQPTSGKYIQQRLRLKFTAKYKELASLHVDAQALDNVFWGDNADLASTPLFAETPSQTGIDGQERPPVEIFRAWVEARLPVGVLRAGRMSSHWGLGLLANDGDGFDDDFGENYYGNSFDRVLFGTNPVSIVQTIMGKKGAKEIPLTLAIAVDRLVEDPLTQYYGYKCSPGINRDTEPDRYDARCDSDGDGITDQDNDYNEDRDQGTRSPNWWADQRDDVWEMVYALIYRGKDIKYFGGIGDLTAGAYVIHRTQKETESNVVVGDIYLDAKVHGVNLQFEGVGIWGKTRALALPNSTADDPLLKRAGIYSYVARLSYEQPKWKVLMESGFASGDENVNDELFTGRSLHPDHNVGLLMYEEVLRLVTARLWGSSARGLRSNGGVYNSHYINPKVYVTPLPNLTLIGGFVAAWPDKADGAVIRCTAADVEKLGCAAASATSDMLGWEIDFAIKHRWHKHLLASVETGYNHVTDRVPLAAAGMAANAKDGGGNFWTLQARLAWEF